MCRHDGQHGVKRYGKIPITTAVNNGAVKCRCSVKKIAVFDILIYLRNDTG